MWLYAIDAEFTKALEVHNLETRLNVLKTNVKAFPYECNECDFVS